jgi:hypothetical protein
MDVRGMGFGGMDWIHLGLDKGQWRADINTIMNHLFP